MLITVLSAFFNIITYILFNSDHGIGCVYSPSGLVTFVAVEGTFVHFTKGHNHYFKFYSLRLLTPRSMHYRVPTEMHWQYWPSPHCEAATNCAF